MYIDVCVYGVEVGWFALLILRSHYQIISFS